MKKTIHFRDEIRNSLISYALIPGIVFAVVIIVSSVIIWMADISRRASVDCQIICNTLETSVRQYVSKVNSITDLSPSDMKNDRNSLSLVYSQLKEFSRRQQIPANFVIIDSDFSVVLQGNADQTFRVPDFQNMLSWGALERMKNNPSDPIIEVSRDYTSSGLSEIIIGKAIPRFDNTDVEGYLLFIISAKDVQDSLRAVSSPFVITDKFGEVFETTSRSYLDELGKLDSRYTTDKNNGLSVTGNEAVYCGFVYGDTISVYTIVNIAQMKTALFILCITTAAFLVVLSMCMILSASKIAAQKTATIDELVSVFRDVENGLPEKHINISTNVEFQTIADAYNKMLDDIHNLIEVNKKEVHEKYISEIKQLEMQFNPHFLYNTLETIKYLIRLEPDSAVKTIVSLSELLRYSINGEVSLVTVESDMKYIENYLDILKRRFSTRFTYELSIDESVKRAAIPKLIIQPVIENSVKYGFDSAEAMCIVVSVSKVDDDLVITVTDNGAGMEPSDLTSIRRVLQSKFNDTNHIGLHNVQRRIQLVYGEQYGIKISSHQGKGTTVTLRLPCVPK